MPLACPRSPLAERRYLRVNPLDCRDVTYVTGVKPSERAGDDFKAFDKFLKAFDRNAGVILGVQRTPPQVPGVPPNTLTVIVRTQAEIQEARDAISKASGRVATPWKRHGGDSFDLDAEVDNFLDNPTAARGDAILPAVMKATGRVDERRVIAVERENSRMIRALAWYVRLPSEIAEAAGLDHEKSGRAIGRLAQIAVPAVPAALGLLKVLT